MCTKNKNIQDRLWIEGEAPLKDIITLVKKAELSERCAKAASPATEGVFVSKISNDKKGKTPAFKTKPFPASNVRRQENYTRTGFVCYR